MLLSGNFEDYGPVNSNYAADIFFGFSSALLGVSGFESSANYIEVYSYVYVPQNILADEIL